MNRWWLDGSGNRLVYFLAVRHRIAGPSDPPFPEDAAVKELAEFEIQSLRVMAPLTRDGVDAGSIVASLEAKDSKRTSDDFITDFVVRDTAGHRVLAVHNLHFSLQQYEDLLTGTDGLFGLMKQVLSGNDEIAGKGSTGETLFLYTGAENDAVHGGLADEIVSRGGGGMDTVSYLDISNQHGLNADLTTGKFINPYGRTDNLTNGENIDGAILNDVIVGSKVANLLSASIGNDMLKGLDGNDGLTGGEGKDKLYGGNGNDRCARRNRRSVLHLRMQELLQGSRI